MTGRKYSTPRVPLSTAVLYMTGESTLGAVLVAASARGVCAILLGDQAEELAAGIRRRFPGAIPGDDPRLERLLAQAVQVVDGASRSDFPLDPHGTDFEHRVWAAVAEVPAGSVVSYRVLAERLGMPRAVRAVARACASNHIAVAIPCHRVVRSDGGLAGYQWGLAKKRALLAREAVA